MRKLILAVLLIAACGPSATQIDKTTETHFWGLRLATESLANAKRSCELSSEMASQNNPRSIEDRDRACSKWRDADKSLRDKQAEIETYCRERLDSCERVKRLQAMAR
ncbi:hypothetical protein [Anaeromyxobacter sp. PSR-1]|uniref:hypothetical protein n=1 Tax=Anaeromyxobacter sp. PSR-1 TaxID=1300915 RepID=UPI0005DDA644|nr:hypothetical protein [Anaeromyxobacter sp. PSR-1]GAO01939.1 hypothetical protein PSR1_00802 [Anaeromyxobacter sp. PSR-1]